MTISSSNSPTNQFFYELTPNRILDAVEKFGVQCTGACSALGSYENRVYEVEIELDERPRRAADRFRIAKFYRPGRWSEIQIREEHRFMNELLKDEIPVVAPYAVDTTPEPNSLLQTPDGIWYTLFPKMPGRAPDELTPDQLHWLGRLIARMHQVGSRSPAPSRLTLSPADLITPAVQFVIQKGFVPAQLEAQYEDLCGILSDRLNQKLKSIQNLRIHGDCHRGNLLWNENGPFFLDFDDFMMGPAVQDFWLLLPQNEEDFPKALAALVEGYEQIRKFDRAELDLVEGLRALRFVHFAGWLAKRWEDPAFPLAFPNFGTQRYWDEQIIDLRNQLSVFR